MNSIFMIFFLHFGGENLHLNGHISLMTSFNPVIEHEIHDLIGDILGATKRSDGSDCKARLDGVLRR